MIMYLSKTYKKEHTWEYVCVLVVINITCVWATEIHVVTHYQEVTILMDIQDRAVLRNGEVRGLK